MKLTPWDMLSSQLTTTPAVPSEDLSGKTVIVVGANSGIGYETAKHLAYMGPGKLILACRDKGRGDAAAERMMRETHCNNIEMWLLDLGSFESVNSFVDRVESEKLPRIDLLIENAAVLPTETLDGTQDGWERTFQVNNLSTSLLALLLMPRMIKTAQEFNTKPRIVVVSSEVHYFAKLQDKVLKSNEPLRAFGMLENCDEKDITNRYYDTKSERIRHHPLIVDAVNPGYCLSNLRKGLRGIRAAVDWVMEKLIARTSEEGARQVVWAAIGGKDDEDSLRGAYVSQMGAQEPSDFVLSTEGKTFQEKIEMLDELCSANAKLQPVVYEYLSNPSMAPTNAEVPGTKEIPMTSTTSPAMNVAINQVNESTPPAGENASQVQKEVEGTEHPKSSYADAVGHSARAEYAEAVVHGRQKTPGAPQNVKSEAKEAGKL